MSLEITNQAGQETQSEIEAPGAMAIDGIIKFVDNYRGSEEAPQMRFKVLETGGPDGSRAIDPDILLNSPLLHAAGISVKGSVELVTQDHGLLIESRITELSLGSDEPGPVIVEKTIIDSKGSHPSKPLITRPNGGTARLFEQAG